MSKANILDGTVSPARYTTTTKYVLEKRGGGILPGGAGLTERVSRGGISDTDEGTDRDGDRNGVC